MLLLLKIKAKAKIRVVVATLLSALGTQFREASSRVRTKAVIVAIQYRCPFQTFQSFHRCAPFKTFDDSKIQRGEG